MPYNAWTDKKGKENVPKRGKNENRKCLSGTWERVRYEMDRKVCMKD